MSEARRDLEFLALTGRVERADERERAERDEREIS